MPGYLYYVAFAGFVASYWMLMSRRRQSALEGTSSMRAGEVARRLAPAIGVLDDQTYVHVIGEAGKVSMPFTLGAIYLLAGSPRTFLQKLDVLSRALEGQR